MSVRAVAAAQPRCAQCRAIEGDILAIRDRDELPHIACAQVRRPGGGASRAAAALLRGDARAASLGAGAAAVTVSSDAG